MRQSQRIFGRDYKKVRRPMQEPGALATEGQVWMLRQIGYSQEDASLMTRGEASMNIGEYMKAQKQQDQSKGD